jgi:hypothetical protein
MPVYILRAEGEDIVKIGFTSSPQIWKRLKAIQSNSPIKLGILLYFLEEGRSLETSLHREFRQYRLHGEWFRYEGELVDFVQEHRKFQHETRMKRLKENEEAEEKENAQENG